MNLLNLVTEILQSFKPVKYAPSETTLRFEENSKRFKQRIYEIKLAKANGTYVEEDNDDFEIVEYKKTA